MLDNSSLKSSNHTKTAPHTFTDNTLTDTQRRHIEHLKYEMLSKYPHLHLRFYPDSICMQAKIDINVKPGESLLLDPGLYSEILQAENFIVDNFEHRLPSNHGKKDGRQYVLVNEKIAKIGHKFVLKATFGPRFISLWFRNESSCDRLEIPLCYALEILNKLHDRLNRVSPKTINNDLEEKHYYTGFTKKAS